MKGILRKNEEKKVKKKIVLIMMAAVLTMSIAACGSNKDTAHITDTENGTETVSSAVEVLEKVWAVYEEDEKPIVMGGDAENMIDGAPGAYNIQDLEGINALFHITEDAAAMADEAASAVHAMNANTFTSSVFHVTDTENVEAFVSSVKESVLSTHWVCGFPEKLIILSVDENYVLSAFGNGEMMDLLKEKVTEVYGEAAAVLAEEVIE